MKNKILDILKSTNGYISGEDISDRLSVSRSAVWKHIKKLKSEGYEITSVTNKGYRLSRSPDLVTASEIQSGLDTNIFGKNVVYFDETDSTNNEAKRNSNMDEGTLFIAEVQTMGKGRLGRNWQSPKGDGIWMSILLKPDIAPNTISQITIVAGLSVCRALSAFNAKIKWPNDIVIGSKKVCGILTEMSAEIDMVNYVVCGIGINVNTSEFDAELSQKATSLFIETGDKHNRAEIVQRVLSELEGLYYEFLENGLKNILDEYKALCVTLNKDVSIVSKNEICTAKAIDIDPTGALVAEQNGKTLTVTSGEVSVRGIYGYV